MSTIFQIRGSNTSLANAWLFCEGFTGGGCHEGELKLTSLANDLHPTPVTGYEN
jgi:hypothetical protein